MERTRQLAALIESLSVRDGAYSTVIEGLYLSKSSSTNAPRHVVDSAVFCIVAQGAKSVLLGKERYVYDPHTYLVASLDLPLVGHIVEASRQKPMLGITIELDFAEISALMIETDLLVQSNPVHGQSLFVHTLDEDLLDAVIRLVCLLNKPTQIPVLAPLIRREIFYKLLLGDQSGLLRQMTTENSQVRRIAAGIVWLKQNLTRPIRMEELAREVNMSPSTMHTWFKAVTTMSPLQFQKQLRLQEARRMLLSETTDVTTTSRRVGYESPSQFSREYRRLFGLPPLQDIERLRTTPTGLHKPVQLSGAGAG
ncbi:MAG: AraC family transcriptional regulator [Blastochloris sp.]|nr:AraC family transcriptional regulator [Blastochloris sp.]